MTNNDNFDDEAIEIDSYCATHDIDDYDLYGEIMVEDNDDNCDILFE